jgi:hypothetical protein
MLRRHTDLQIIHKVLFTSAVQDPVGLARAAKTCKELRAHIYGVSLFNWVWALKLTQQSSDTALWRDIYLDLYDDPRRSGSYTGGRLGVDWQNDVQQREYISRISKTWGDDDFEERLVSCLHDVFG